MYKSQKISKSTPKIDVRSFFSFLFISIIMLLMFTRVIPLCLIWFGSIRLCPFHLIMFNLWSFWGYCYNEAIEKSQKTFISNVFWGQGGSSFTSFFFLNLLFLSFITLMHKTFQPWNLNIFMTRLGSFKILE